MLSIFVTTRQNPNKFGFALAVPKIRVKKERSIGNLLYLCTVKFKTTKKMEAMTLPRQLLVTVDGGVNLANVRRAISMLKGVTKVKAQKAKTRLYDPETGEYLNDKTMKAIEDVRSGKDKGTTYSSFEEFEKAMRAL